MRTQEQRNNDLMIAKEIMNQLGGIGKLNAMIGLKELVAVENGVLFKIKYKGALANCVKITLNGLDLYDVEIGKLRGYTYKVICSENNLYNDMLKPLIENTCKIRLSL